MKTIEDDDFYIEIIHFDYFRWENNLVLSHLVTFSDHNRFRVALNSKINHDFELCDEFFRIMFSLYISSAVIRD